MELSRRDAIAALAAAGVAIGAEVRADVALDSLDGDEADDEGALADHELATMVAAAEVLYPSDVEGVEQFVSQYLEGIVRENPDDATGIADAVAFLDEYAAAWHDEEFAALDPAVRDEALRGMNADTTDPDPTGSDVERVRYYVVNELLYALYTTPTGGKLVGLENPQGYPGGLGSYQRGPQA